MSLCSLTTPLPSLLSSITECVFTVEPNYVVRARGKTTRIRGGRSNAPPPSFTSDQTKQSFPIDVLESNEAQQRRRRLAIPEFNLKESPPANWGLERISSRGARNGAYMWVHEGLETHIYIFDTGIYPDHSDWQGRNGTRYGDGLLCTGTPTDYESNDHGTFVASIAAGWTFGTARSAIFHPIQVLDATGTGTTASLLCGMEKLLVDGKEYNAAHWPKKIRSLVNLSLGVNGRSDALDKAVKDMTDVGYTVVIAAGDENGELKISLQHMSRCYSAPCPKPYFYLLYPPTHRKCMLLQPLRCHGHHGGCPVR